ncbi:MAG TPA: cupredoxin domain-containing protein [Rhizobiaceae bacterium]|nr:cupredoxin domain-containing protein [Rhizobiaceae bacterium]
MRALLAAVIMSMVSAPLSAETITVTIENMAFSPVKIDAKVGDTIEWVNKDIFDHTATVDGRWDVVVPVGKTGTLIVETAEIVDYFCRFHPNMKGKIIATAP